MANLIARLAGSISLVAMTTLVMSAAQPAAAQIAGSGATSIEAAVDAGFLLGFPYSAIGSGAGRTAFNAGTVDFAASDNTQIGGAINVNAINIPVVAIGDAAVEGICGALTGNKPEGVTVIGRLAGSGTRNIVETACGGTVVADQEFASNDEVAAAVAATPNSIGYADGPAAAAAGSTLIGSIAEGPNFIIFRPVYDSQEKADAAKTLCQFVTGGGRDLAVGLGYTAGSDSSDVCEAIAGPAVEEGSGEQ